METLLAIPVFNEARFVLGVVDSVRRYGLDTLVIDDGSTDQTPRMLAKRPHIRVIRHAYNLGYGKSLIDAFAYAAQGAYDWVITMDCDEQHAPAWIPRFLAEARRDDADIISGSRYLNALPGNSAPPPDRRRINQEITATLNAVLGLLLTDAFCGFKAHRVTALGRLRLTVADYAFPLQFWVEAVRAGLRIRELAVPLIYSDPNRHFGGSLDDPDHRLKYYRGVLYAALRASRAARPPVPLCECA